jgi:DNA-binding winged helix-turn-helix (wHTH) protein/thioredoxin-like negative regulator of GroEL
MEQGSDTKYRFGPYTLEQKERRISGDGNVRIELTAKAFDLLVLLVSRNGQLVTKDEILDEVWQDVSIAESNVTTTISMIRKALREDSEHRYVETVPKKGYRFIAPVKSEVPRARPTEEPSQPVTVPVAPPERVPWYRSFNLGLSALALVVVGGAFWFWHSSRAPAYETLLRNSIQLEAAGDDKLALASLDEALKLNPGSNEALLRAAWLSYEADNDDEATPYLNRMGKSENSSTDTAKAKETRLMGEGLTMLLAGDADGALSKFDVALGFAPNDTDALFHIAEVATANDNFDKADQALQKCLKVDDRNPFCGFQRIETLTYEGHYDLAIKEYARLIQEGSKYPWLDAAVGDAELAMGDTASALRRFNALAVSSHTLASAVHFRASQDGIATVDAYQGKRNDAQIQLKSALETATSGYSKAAYFLLMAKINTLYGHKAEGKDDLLNVPSLSHSGELALSLARTFAMAEDFVAARAVLHEHSEDAAALGQSFPAAEQFIDGLEALQRHETEVSVAQLANSNRIESSPETAYFMAQAEMEQGDWQGAINSLNDLLGDRGAIVIDGPAALIPLAEYDLSICYRKSGRDSDAESHFASVLSMWNKADADIKAKIRSSKEEPAAIHH